MRNIRNPPRAKNLDAVTLEGTGEDEHTQCSPRSVQPRAQFAVRVAADRRPIPKPGAAETLPPTTTTQREQTGAQHTLPKTHILKTLFL
jgi:hypothetical protein